MLFAIQELASHAVVSRHVIAAVVQQYGANIEQQCISKYLTYRYCSLAFHHIKTVSHHTCGSSRSIKAHFMLNFERAHQ